MAVNVLKITVASRVRRCWDRRSDCANKSDSGDAEQLFHIDVIRRLVVVIGAVGGGLDLAVVPTTELGWRNVASTLSVTSDMLVFPIRDVFGDEALAIPSGDPISMDQLEIAITPRLSVCSGRYFECEENRRNRNG